jgi:predicted MFS family arabinose efflux permease
MGVLATGTAVLIIADVILAFSSSIWPVLAGVAFWGLHMGFTQGLLATLVADTAPADLRGTAFGVFNFAIGLAMLAASVIAGRLWDLYGPAATFLAGAAFTTLALVGLLIAVPGRKARS